MANSTGALNTDPRRRWVGIAKQLVRLAIFVVVCWFIWRKVDESLADFERRNFSLADVEWGWLAVAGLFYTLAMLPSWWFWHRTLLAMGQQPTCRESIRAHFIGHLGKYVPGKALVVIIRTALVRGPRVDAAAAAIAVFIETLTLMAVGACVAAVLIAVLFRDQQVALAWAVLLMLAAGIPTLPPIFRRVVRWLKVHRASPQIDRALEGVDYRLMGIGWLALGASWFLYGWSLWATLRATPTLVAEPPGFFASAPLLTACMALAMVAGFLSLLPGGIGAREFFVMLLLGPAFGEAAALVAAVLLRLVWLVAEAGLSAILWFFVRPSRVESAALA